MYSLVIFSALTIAAANAGLIGAPLAAPLATSVIGAKTISLAAPGYAAPIAPWGLGAPIYGKSLLAAPALAAPAIAPWGLGAPVWGKSIIAAPAVSTVAVGPALGAPLLKAW